mgnify:CR=1 FL=1
MKFTYISPSEVPSRAANSVHVVMQCDALVQVGAELTIYVKRTMPKAEKLLWAIQSSYGIDFSKARLVSVWSGSRRGSNLRIAVIALWDLFSNPWPDIILSRNLYASFIIAVIVKRPLLFETHQLELGIRKYIQCKIMSCSSVTTVVISKQLKKYLIKHHKRAPSKTLVLHDAAPECGNPVSKSMRYSSLMEIYPEAKGTWQGVCGYFGHLYAGRGVEIIELMAKARPGVLFLLFGGNEADVEIRRRSSEYDNVHYVGHVSFPLAQKVMRSVDVLLMPYQESVSIGVSGHDTARWMSPMKMFEYMATGVPIISSDLPVLCEVLRNGHNALLVPPSNSQLWITALDEILSDDQLAGSISEQAYQDYLMKHTWNQRAHRLIRAGKELQ